VRVSKTRLIDTSAGCCPSWAEQYDRYLTDILAVKDDITRVVVAALEPALVPRRDPSVIVEATEAHGAWDWCQRGVGMCTKGTANGGHLATDIGCSTGALL